MTLAESSPNQMVVLKLDFCGSMAGTEDWIHSACQGKTNTSCEEYVRTNLEAFVDTFFAIEYIKLFQVG